MCVFAKFCKISVGEGNLCWKSSTRQLTGRCPARWLAWPAAGGKRQRGREARGREARSRARVQMQGAAPWPLAGPLSRWGHRAREGEDTGATWGWEGETLDRWLDFPEAGAAVVLCAEPPPIWTDGGEGSKCARSSPARGKGQPGSGREPRSRAKQHSSRPLHKKHTSPMFSCPHTRGD